jgi:hypothetical protein
MILSKKHFDPAMEAILSCAAFWPSLERMMTGQAFNPLSVDKKPMQAKTQ